MHRGYVKLYRKSIENPLFKKPLIWHYFEYCLLKANHKDKKMIWNKKEITIERGSFLTGRIEAAKETGLSEQNVRTAQKTLINVGALLKIPEKSTSKHTYLTVCNYDDYQEDKKAPNQQVTSSQPASNQQPTTNKNEQTLKSTKKKTKEPVFSPLKDRQEFIANLPEKMISDFGMFLINQTIEDLVNYCEANGKSYKNYYAALRNFLKNAKPIEGQPVKTKEIFKKVEQTPEQIEQIKLINQANVKKMRA